MKTRACSFAVMTSHCDFLPSMSSNDWSDSKCCDGSKIEMMFEWKKSLDHLGDFTTDLLVEYVESKISPYTLNESGQRTLSVLLKKHDINVSVKAKRGLSAKK